MKTRHFARLFEFDLDGEKAQFLVYVDPDGEETIIHHIVNFDGELNQRWATPIRLRGRGEVLLARRMGWSAKVLLLSDGTVEGNSYTKRWWEEE